METNDLIILSIVVNLSVLIIYIIFNWSTFWSRLKGTKEAELGSSDEFRIETKTNIRFLFMAASLILPVIIFLGISSVNDLKQDVADEIKKATAATETIQRLNQEVETYEKNVIEFKNSSDEFEKKISSYDNRILSLDSKLSLQTKQIADIRNFVFLEPIFWQPKENNIGPFTVKFSEIKSLNGVVLPEFIYPPRIIQINTSVNLFTLKVSRTEFTYEIGNYTDGNQFELQFLVFY